MPIKCIQEGYDKRPHYNYPPSRIPIYCSTHQLHGMICVTTPKCKEEGCLTQTCYNLPNEKKGLYCLIIYYTPLHI